MKPMLALFGSLGTWEVILIAGVVLLLFGTRLPSVMRSLGKGVVEFKKGLNDVSGAGDEPAPRDRLPQGDGSDKNRRDE